MSKRIEIAVFEDVVGGPPSGRSDFDGAPVAAGAPLPQHRFSAPIAAMSLMFAIVIAAVPAPALAQVTPQPGAPSRAQSATALPQLVRAYQNARAHDPLYQSARAELEGGRIGARAAGAAYYPTLQIATNRFDFESGDRRTITLSQPILSADKYATYKEAEPREQLAQATFLAREQDLALRLFRVVAEVIRAVESLSTNGSRIEAMQQQAAAAKRSYELGQGTITDLRDTQVRLDQARATELTVMARKSAAERQYAAIVGEPLPPRAYGLAREKRSLRLTGASDYLPVALELSPQVITARMNARLAELGVLRAKGAFLPTVSANLVQSKLSGGASTSYAGMSLTLPLQAGSLYTLSGAEANSLKVQALVRDAEQQVRLEVERLLTFVDAGRSETDIRIDAIRSAELSVTANEKSYAGGVRTTIDVLNAIQALYQTREEYVNAVLTLAENLLSLRLKAATPAQDALTEVSNLLF